MTDVSVTLGTRTKRVVRWLVGQGIPGIGMDRARITGISRFAIHVSGRRFEEGGIPRQVIVNAFESAERRSEGKPAIVFYSMSSKGASSKPDGMLVLMRGSTFGELFVPHILQNPERFLLGRED